MKEDDVALLDEISEDLTDSLHRVHSNGTRAFAIVERMSGLGVVGGELVPTDLNNVLQAAVQTGCDTFRANWEDFEIQPVFNLDNAVDRIDLLQLAVRLQRGSGQPLVAHECLRCSGQPRDERIFAHSSQHARA